MLNRFAFIVALTFCVSLQAQDLDTITWKDLGFRRRAALKLKSDGTYALVEIQRVASMSPAAAKASPEELGAGDPEKSGDRFPTKYFTFKEVPKVTKGRWSVASAPHNIVLLDREGRAARLRQFGTEKPTWEMERFYLTKAKGIAPHVRKNFVSLNDGWLIHYSDVSRFQGEVDISGLLKSGVQRAPLKLPVSAATIKRIRSALPQGWRIGIGGDRLVVRRDQKIDIEHHIPNGPGFSSPAEAWNDIGEGRYVVELTFQPRMTLTKHKATVQDLKERMGKMRIAMKAFADPPNRIPSPSGYSPRNEADRKLLEQYEEFDRKLRYLPDFYDERNSVYIDDNLMMSVVIPSRKVEKECEQMRKRIESLFTKYGAQ